MAKSQKPLGKPMSYNEYTKESLKDVPPNIALAEHMRAQQKGTSVSPANDITVGKTKSLLKTINQYTIVTINVSGTRFEVSGVIYSKLEPAILNSGDTTHVQINSGTGYPEIFIERHPACFAAILDYFRSEELHMPSDVCPSVFKRELSYWQLRHNVMESCCLRKFAAFHSNEETLKNCHLSFTQWRGTVVEHPPTRWGRFRKAGWTVMDDPKSGALAKIYLCLASFFVVLSIFLLAASTDPTFNRELSSDEWEEFMSSDDLYNYWDLIYPGQAKPDRSISDFQFGQDSTTMFFSSTSSTTELPQQPPVPGKKKRSVSGGVGYDILREDTLSNVPKTGTGTGTSKENNSGKHTGTSKENNSGKHTGTSKENHSGKYTGTSKESHSGKYTGTSKENNSGKHTGTSKESHSGKYTGTSKETHSGKHTGTSKESHSGKHTGTSKESHSGKYTGTSKETHSGKHTGTSKENHSGKHTGTSKETHSGKYTGTSKESHSGKRGGDESLSEMSFRIKEGIEKVFKHFIKENSRYENNEILAELINDDEALSNHIQTQKKAIADIDEGRDDDGVSSDMLTNDDNNLKQKDDLKDKVEKQSKELHEYGVMDKKWHSDNENYLLKLSEFLQNERKIRRRRSVNQSSNLNNQQASSTSYFSLEDIDNATCVYMDREGLQELIESVAVTTMIATGDFSLSELPSAQTVYKWVEYVEMACVAFFTAEFILRVLFAPSLCHFLFSFLTLMDLISLAAMYAALLVQYINPEFKYTPSAMDAVNCFQITRVFRFFRLVKDVVGFRVLLLSVRTSWKELLLLLLYIMMAVSIFATIVYFCERDNMKSIPESAWWAVVTMTTVGYGDMAPKSLQGRLTGMACAMSGVLLIAVTVPIFVNNFILFYEYSKITMDSEFYQEKSKGEKGESSGSTVNDTTKSEYKHNSSKQSRIHASRPDSNPASLNHRRPSSSSFSSAKIETFGLNNCSVFSRTNSSKSLLSQNTTVSPKGCYNSANGKNPEVKSVASASRVTAFVCDLELEQDGDVFDNKGKISEGRKSDLRKNKNSKSSALA